MRSTTSRIFWRSLAIAAEKSCPLESNVKSFGEIPGPKPLPLLGNIWRYFPLIGEYSMERIHNSYFHMYEQYGPLVREKLFSTRTLVHVFDLEDMATVYKNEGRRPHRVSHRALEKYRKDRPHLYNGPGLFPSNGEEWYNFRRLFQRTLVDPRTAEACLSELENITNDFIKRIPHLLDDKSEMDLQPELFSFAIECIGMITLNKRLGCLTPEGNPAAAALVKAANDIHHAVFMTENTPIRYKKNYRILEAGMDLLSSTVSSYIKDSLEDPSSNKDCLLFKLMNAKNADTKDVFTMILDMFLAGIDTTAYSIGFGLYNLSINKKVQERLREELRERLPNQNSRFSDISQKIPYLQNVISETLRLNPVALGTGRVLPIDLVLSGYNVPAGTYILLQHQVACMQEKYFPNPHLFEPDRWLGDTPPLVSSPFGVGPRMCIGMRLAQKEIQLALSKMVLHYDMSYHYEPIGCKNRLINVPDRPLRLRLKRLQY
ncbi:cytochrome P450 302a1, mitochondrial-like [Uloborus diversus]|uniref:cytochrome P450 302a1, mitochondrial-like n=1 Tax=Uloborus diversus TaxID=327109 RepID=UPI002409961D|nr:cytochrome P450 302a1, mitochondrial-like [Uloborus diversus]